jgi:hypothetical protein
LLNFQSKTQHVSSAWRGELEEEEEEEEGREQEEETNVDVRQRDSSIYYDYSS